MANATLSRIRKSEKAVSEWVSVLKHRFGDTNTEKCLKALSSAVVYASFNFSDRWALTFRPAKIRLDVGSVETFTLYANGRVRSMVFNPSLKIPVYARAPHCQPNNSDIDGPIFGLWNLRSRAIDEAAKMKMPGGWKAAHSPSVVAFLNRAYDLKIPNPSHYFDLSGPGLRVLMGGFGNGDRKSLDGAFKKTRKASGWVVPKNSKKGDDAIIVIQGDGLYATAKITSEAKKDSYNGHPAFRAALTDLSPIVPAIKLSHLRDLLPDWGWLRYPRRTTTPPPEIAERIWRIIDSYSSGTVLSKSGPPKFAARTSLQAIRDPRWRREVLRRSLGRCEWCKQKGPFLDRNRELYLEAHHVKRVAQSEGGHDHPHNMLALCPNCHRRTEFAKDADEFNAKLSRRLVEVVKSASR